MSLTSRLTPKELHERLQVYLSVGGPPARESANAWIRRATSPQALTILRPESRRGIPQRIGKTLIGQNLGTGLVYEESKEDKPRLSQVGVELVEHADAADLHATMRGLMTDDFAAVTLGHLTAEAAEVIGASFGRLAISRLKHDGQRWGTFCDHPTHIFILDVDKLPLPKGWHAIEDWPEIVNWIGKDVLPEEFGESELGFYPTSKAGLVRPDLAQLRIVAWLRKPLSLDEQAHYVGEVLRPAALERCKEWAGHEPFDLSIYQPQAYVYTARPRIVLVDGAEMPDPFPSRYMTLPGAGDGLPIEVDPTALKQRRRAGLRKIAGEMPAGSDGVDQRARDDITRGDNVNAVRSYAGRRLEEIASDVKPGNTQIPILSIIAKVAIATPAHRMNEAQAQLAAAFREFIPQIPGDHSKLNERIKETVEQLPRKWEMAVKKFKYSWADLSYGFSPINRVSLAEGRSAVAEIVHQAIHDGLNWRHDESNVFIVAPHTLVNATLGVGKTEALISALRDVDIASYRIHVLVPTDRLGQELLIRLRGRIDLKYHDHYLRHHRGRNQPGMCINETHGKLAAAMEEMGFSPYDEVCKSCPSHGECPWAQQHGDRGPGVIIRTHSHLQSTYRNATATSAHAPNLFVIDESPLGSLLTAPPPVPLASILPQGEFQTFRAYVWDKGKRKRVERSPLWKTADWRVHRQRWHDVLQAAGDQIRLAEFSWLQRMSGDGELDEAQWATRIEGQLREHINKRLLDLLREARDAGGKPPEPLAKLIAANKEQRQVSLALSRLITMIRESLKAPGRQRAFGARIILHKGQKCLSIAYTDGMPDILRETPTLILDATAGREVQNALSAEWDQLKVHEVNISPGAYHLTMVGNETFSRSSLRVTPEDADMPGLPEEESKFRRQKTRRKTNRMSMLHRAIYSIALEHRVLNRGEKYDVLVLCQKGVDEAIRGFGHIPRVEFLTYGNVRGINEYKNIRCIVAIGRATPGRETLEQHAEALHLKSRGLADITLSTNWISGQRDIEMADGSWMRIMSEVHPDPVVESYRRQIVDAEVVQGVGRGRVILRDDGNPVRLIMFGQTDIGLPVHSLASRNDFGRSGLEIMTERGLIFESVGPTRALYDELLPENDRNARDECAGIWQLALEKCTHGTLLPPSGRLPHWTQVRFRFRGAVSGQALVDLALLKNEALALVDALGPRVQVLFSSAPLPDGQEPPDDLMDAAE